MAAAGGVDPFFTVESCFHLGDEVRDEQIPAAGLAVLHPHRRKGESPNGDGVFA